MYETILCMFSIFEGRRKDGFAITFALAFAYAFSNAFLKLFSRINREQVL